MMAGARSVGLGLTSINPAPRISTVCVERSAASSPTDSMNQSGSPPLKKDENIIYKFYMRLLRKNFSVHGVGEKISVRWV